MSKMQRRISGLLVVVFSLAGCAAQAQSSGSSGWSGDRDVAPLPPIEEQIAITGSDVQPEHESSAWNAANGPQLNANSAFAARPHTVTGTQARKFHLVIHSDEFGVPLSSREKLELSLVSRLSLSDLTATAFSAGWSQMLDSAPHYGVDSRAFGDRVGATAIRQTAQSLFSYGIYADLFHDDPRYYVMGHRRSFGARLLYSATRLVIAQKDAGSLAVNWPKLAGIASSTALTNVYYPARDHGFGNSVSAFGMSLCTSVLNNELHEFLGDGLRIVKSKTNLPIPVPGHAAGSSGL